MYGGKVPTDYGALGYAGVRTVLAAVKNAGSVDTDKVIAALEALKYDFYKGPQYYRKCDHQSVQSVLVIKSKSKDMRERHPMCSRSSRPTSPTRRTCAAARSSVTKPDVANGACRSTGALPAGGSAWPV